MTTAFSLSFTRHGPLLHLSSSCFSFFPRSFPSMIRKPQQLPKIAFGFCSKPKIVNSTFRRPYACVAASTSAGKRQVKERLPGELLFFLCHIL